MSGVFSKRADDGRTLVVTLDNPKGNVLTMALLQELDLVLEEHRSDDRLKWLVIRSEGRHFSFGASVEEHTAPLAPQMLRAFHGTLLRVAGYPVPVAALVQGKCLGGAFELTLACHLVFATPDASFAVPEIKLGVFPPAFSVLAPIRLGPVAEALALTGAEISAERLRGLGFVTEIVPGEAPMAAIEEWFAKNLAPLSAVAIRHATRALRRSSGLLDRLGYPLEQLERQYVAELMRTADANEGIAAFLERRSPHWRDA